MLQWDRAQKDHTHVRLQPALCLSFLLLLLQHSPEPSPLPQTHKQKNKHTHKKLSPSSHVTIWILTVRGDYRARGKGLKQELTLGLVTEKKQP